MLAWPFFSFWSRFKRLGWSDCRSVTLCLHGRYRVNRCLSPIDLSPPTPTRMRLGETFLPRLDHKGLKRGYDKLH